MKPVTFPIRISPEEHKKIKIAAAMAEMSIHDFIIEAIMEKIEKGGNHK